jgi:hypothetical protein
VGDDEGEEGEDDERVVGTKNKRGKGTLCSTSLPHLFAHSNVFQSALQPVSIASSL